MSFPKSFFEASTVLIKTCQEHYKGEKKKKKKGIHLNQHRPKKKKKDTNYKQIKLYSNWIIHDQFVFISGMKDLILKN